MWQSKCAALAVVCVATGWVYGCDGQSNDDGQTVVVDTNQSAGDGQMSDAQTPKPDPSSVDDEPVEVTERPGLTPSDRTGLPDAQGIEPGPPEPLNLSAMEAVDFGPFVTSTACSMCHSNHANATAMRNSEDQEIAPFNLWQGSMMANSARDPLWHAAVSVEVAQNPSQAAKIEDKCIRCHAPMASEIAHERGEPARMAQLFDAGTGDAYVGLDGVACAVCHQIEKEGLGDEESFSGGFIIGTERKIYGPHRNPATGPMQNHVNYTPTYRRHVTSSKMCGTCHTLFTNPFTPEGEEIEGVRFPEQTTYLEWVASAYKEMNTSCQDCHMPTTDEYGVTIETRIARAPPGFDFFIDPRQPFGQHIFTGANTLMPDIIRRERATLQPQASDEAFEATIAAARRYLQEKASGLEVSEEGFDGSRIRFDLQVFNHAGHKFPTGVPMRRAWLRVKVTDGDGGLLFVSGDFNDRGRLVDQNGDILDVDKAGGGWEPHRDIVRKHDEVQIYETIMADVDGRQTDLLLRAATYLKDNRLLPLGFNAVYEKSEDVQPHGLEGDINFAGGQDQVTYEIEVGERQEVRVEATLFYQPLGARAMRDLFQNDTPEVAAFRGMYERADPTPEEVAHIEFEVQRN